MEDAHGKDMVAVAIKDQVRIRCRCGKMIMEKTALRWPDRPNVFVCPKCGLNHEMVREGDRQVCRLRYYFPED